MVWGPFRRQSPWEIAPPSSGTLWRLAALKLCTGALLHSETLRCAAPGGVRVLLIQACLLPTSGSCMQPFQALHWQR